MKNDMTDNLLTGELRNVTRIFKFQLGLAGILQTIMNVPKVFLIQYNEESAW